MASTIQPRNPKPFCGERDALKVHAWFCQVEQCFKLVEEGGGKKIDDATKLRHATTLLENGAALWLYSRVQAGQVPITWNTFKEALSGEFVPLSHIGEARAKLRVLRQRTSVEGYLKEFRSIILNIPGMTDEEEYHRFFQCPKRNTQLEVLKAKVRDFESASQVAFNIDRAVFSPFSRPGGDSRR